MIRVLFVCTGNICRSPTADGVLRKLVADAGLDAHIDVDSCGLSAFHVGELPDIRTREMAKSRGYDLGDIRARRIRQPDYEEFDHILAMDHRHFSDMTRQAPPECLSKIELFLDYHPDLRGQSVPDPYYGGADGFVRVFDMIEETAHHFLAHLRDKLDP